MMPAPFCSAPPSSCSLPGEKKSYHDKGVTRFLPSELALKKQVRRQHMNPNIARAGQQRGGR